MYIFNKFPMVYLVPTSIPAPSLPLKDGNPNCFSLSPSPRALVIPIESNFAARSSALSAPRSAPMTGGVLVPFVSGASPAASLSRGGEHVVAGVAGLCGLRLRARDGGIEGGGK